MQSSPRGLVLVLSNVDFEASEFEMRRGGEVDEDVLKRLFVELNFIVVLRKNLTAQVPDCLN